MSGDRLNLNKPCTACRRRKVRCDKNQPCQNCVKHSVSCVYEGDSSGAGFGADQNVLHERIDKLEKIIQQMSAANSHAGKSPGRRSPEIESPSRSSRDSDESSPRGVLVTEPHVSYYMSPNFWINQQDFVLEPRYLTQVGFDDVQESAWPFGIASPMPSSLAHMHLPIEKENLILDEFWQNVEPFIKIAHRATWKADLAEFRRGAHVLERVFEAAVFSQQLLTIASMSEDRVQQMLGQTRQELVTHFRAATEMAMIRANILRSRVIMAAQVLAYYVTFLYTTGQSEHGSNIVLLAGRVGMRIGLHRDPRHYNLSPWVGEMRRRIWNHLLLMDNQPFSGEGSEGVLDLISNVYRSTNANDEDWVPTRFAKAGTGAEDKEGWTEMTFPIIRQEILGSQRRISKLKIQGASLESIYRSLDDDGSYISRKYLTHLDGSEPIQMVTLSRAKAYMRWFRFQIDLDYSKPPAGKEPSKEQQARLFHEAIEVMEEIHRGESIAAANNWGWIYNWPVPWSMIAFLLSCLAQQPDHPDVDRAWTEVDISFRKYTSSDVQASRLPAWRAIEQLCDRAMYCHSSRMHSSAAYAHRVPQNDFSVSQPLDPSLHDPLFGDVSMLSALPDTDFAMQQIFGAASTGVNVPDNVATQMMYSDWTQPPQRLASTPFLQH